VIVREVGESRRIQGTYIVKAEFVFAGHVRFDTSFGQGTGQELDVLFLIEGDVFEV
jgi:hypothetical protein